MVQATAFGANPNDGTSRGYFDWLVGHVGLDTDWRDRMKARFPQMRNSDISRMYNQYLVRKGRADAINQMSANDYLTSDSMNWNVAKPSAIRVWIRYTFKRPMDETNKQISVFMDLPLGVQKKELWQSIRNNLIRDMVLVSNYRSLTAQDINRRITSIKLYTVEVVS